MSIISYQTQLQQQFRFEQELGQISRDFQKDSFIWKDLNLVPIGHLVPGIGTQIK